MRRRLSDLLAAAAEHLERGDAAQDVEEERRERAHLHEATLRDGARAAADDRQQQQQQRSGEQQHQHRRRVQHAARAAAPAAARSWPASAPAGTASRSPRSISRPPTSTPLISPLRSRLVQVGPSRSSCPVRSARSVPTSDSAERRAASSPTMPRPVRPMSRTRPGQQQRQHVVERAVLEEDAGHRERHRDELRHQRHRRSRRRRPRPPSASCGLAGHGRSTGARGLCRTRAIRSTRASARPGARSPGSGHGG